MPSAAAPYTPQTFAPSRRAASPWGDRLFRSLTLFFALGIIVIAVGIRSYFLQPFKIPTGSMQPTLNGIIGRPSAEPPPNILQQIVEFVVKGRNYINVVSREDDQLLEIQPKKMFPRGLSCRAPRDGVLACPTHDDPGRTHRTGYSS